ncbi:lipopolysaccharide transport periplasmic protein LptA [Nitrosomonas sp.]|uniref:lipopolysaccharide transport periplasmic protein LptA n=1 Tax=Nitrosomonas sp. TaxID=42353 RepID=UPI001D22492F|nr:lipopolysaccharide transport periplasmic protein LptA [Nitrosomonas sp.]MCB1948273.1 lipopolysaccharide transport periplasmic protein LptA [Nitrosomonas sp.]MCP5242313.1 lipopolysaccharide transport periplasmic protein LptA [Burkholderiales bacterium]MDR4514770.1 lipopolysaccharide transport periplasmic protein LptA [Nitrosomonas sp.]
MKRHFFLFPLFLILSLSVFAERADRDKPIHLEADRATVEDINRKDSTRVSVFTGNVILTQGTLRISADKVVIKEDTNGFRHATATGNLVSFRQKQDGIDEYVEGWSQRVEYDNRTDKIELFKQARLKRGEDEVNGDYISYNMNSEFFQVIGNYARNEETSTNTDANNRVRIIIQPKNKSAESNLE